MDSKVFDRAVGALAGAPSSFMVLLCLWRHAERVSMGKTAAPSRRARKRAAPRSKRGLGVEMSHQELARVTGLSRSTVQLALGSLQEKGWVKSVQKVQGRKPRHLVKTAR